jgi:hypothetical protein
MQISSYEYINIGIALLIFIGFYGIPSLFPRISLFFHVLPHGIP